ncbi:hypothetical protein WR25_07762 [Diploscapter pachys]|uniref:Exportin-1/Importin-beta-like domain-containing protein n=1 Tax=Diploscapter pachys TaxID=2018661 RepID=A0A2A2LAA6_9BILA|nr:hypothetical protein WR25_07762 [Diploscapter pachys]
MSEALGDAAQIAQIIGEFYSTADEHRRAQLNAYLCQIRNELTKEQMIGLCSGLIDSIYPSSVQYFGAMTLYTTIRNHGEVIVADQQLLESLKCYLIERLSKGAQTLTQSVTNKLSSTLGLLTLYTIPDIWPDAIRDITLIWSSNEELLLRVLAEIAAEFHNVSMPLAQRSALKSELHRISKHHVVKIISVILQDALQPSLRQAAIECVEQWLKVPGVELATWRETLSQALFAIKDDCPALTSMFGILAQHDELLVSKELVLDLCRYINDHVAEKVIYEIECEGADSEEVCLLISSICSFLENVVSILVKENDLLQSICVFLCKLATWPGKYLIDECVSESPITFFYLVREELANKPKLVYPFLQESYSEREFQPYLNEIYGHLCEAAISKLAWPSTSQLNMEQQDTFVQYRKTNHEIALSAHQIVGGCDVLNFLNSALSASTNDANISRCEAVVFLWEGAADYLFEVHYPSICQCLALCRQLSDSLLTSSSLTTDSERCTSSVMNLFIALSHLVQVHDESDRLQSEIIFSVCLNSFNLSPTTALQCLEKYLEDRPDCIKNCADAICESCYAYFANSANSSKQRLVALKCIGNITFLQNVLYRVIAPYVEDLNADSTNEVSASQASMSSDSSSSKTDKKAFQISIFASLFSSLNNKKLDLGNCEPATMIILRHSWSVLRKIIDESAGTGGSKLGDKVCDAINSALCSLPQPLVGSFLPDVCDLLESALFTNPACASNLAKNLILACGGENSATAPALCEPISNWLSTFNNKLEHPAMDEWMGIVYSVFRKEYSWLRKQPSFLHITSNGLQLCVKLLSSSNEPVVVKTAAQTICSIANQSKSNGDEQVKLMLAECGEQVVGTSFTRIQTPLLRTTLETLAELLFFYTITFPAETRAVIKNSYPEATESQMVQAMLKMTDNARNFKQMVIRINQAALKEQKA